MGRAEWGNWEGNWEGSPGVGIVGTAEAGIAVDGEGIAGLGDKTVVGNLIGVGVVVE